MNLSYKNYDILVSRSKYFVSYHSYMSSRFNKLKSELNIDICLPKNIYPDNFLAEFFYLITDEQLNVDKVYSFIVDYRTNMPIRTVLKKILVIADFFQVDIIFEMLFQIYLVDQIQLAPDMLVCLIDYDKDHPQTEFFLKCLSECLNLTCEQILNMITSNNTSNMLCTNKLKNKIRNMLRHNRYMYKYPGIICSVCEQVGVYLKVDTMKFKYMSLTPCCGSLIHNRCITKFNLLSVCSECTTVLDKGSIDCDLNTLEHCYRRLDKRKQNNIPPDYDLPLLIG